MTKKEINSWRLIIETLVNYGLYDLLENEITIVASCLAREEEKNE